MPPAALRIHSAATRQTPPRPTSLLLHYAGRTRPRQTRGAGLPVKTDLVSARCANVTQPGRGKSQAIKHNRALPKVGQSLRMASLGGLPLRALRVRVMVGYVLRPSPDKRYVGAAIAAWAYSGAARKVALIPRPPGGSACGGSHCVARSRLGRLASRPPRRAPKPNRRVASADFSYHWFASAVTARSGHRAFGRRFGNHQRQSLQFARFGQRANAQPARGIDLEW